MSINFTELIYKTTGGKIKVNQYKYDVENDTDADIRQGVYDFCRTIPFTIGF